MTIITNYNIPAVYKYLKGWVIGPTPLKRREKNGRGTFKNETEGVIVSSVVLLISQVCECTNYFTCMSMH